ncbi:AAA+ ATPase domain-containing protein [Frankia sp. AiPs1]|uniref:SUMF1/EgtB/PvdO family nonheme iron enzyme n=1 Tax=Frankia sp. AiPa1 TaxID=573492 RepID=UPI00202B2476|nr:SUMF1/EgtB/PvdO family nonheme iron enzyme [Frankia sp. AiPa1]MCL9761302.1 SUMF1/EgtB/PvdO family nonheme iron enzyme [Frankia sp. AiPa1]
MTESVDERLRRLQAELNGHDRIARHLGLDFTRPIRSLGDGYPENTVSLVGKIAERLLKQLWTHHQIPGDPNGKALNDLIKGCRPYIRSTGVINAFTDIQRLRNRSSHDGYDIAEEDGLLAVRRLLDVLDWFTGTGVAAITGDAPDLDPLVARKAEFLAGLYATLGYRAIKRFNLSSSTVYQLFCRQVGLQAEYVELMLSRSLDELNQLLASTGGELLDTQLPKHTRFLLVDDEPAMSVAPFADGEIRIITYDRFIERIIDVPSHLAALTVRYPAATPEPGPTPMPRASPEQEDVPQTAPAPLQIAGEVLATDQSTGEMTVTEASDAVQILRRLVEASANALVIGGPGSGKTTLLKRLVVDGGPPAAHRYRFYLDMSLKEPDEDFGEFVTRVLRPYLDVPRNRVFDVFLYLIRSGSVLCVLDAIDEAVRGTSLAAFLDLFADVAQAMSAESTVVLASRYSFLADSPEVRRLLNSSSLISERIVQQLHAGGVDPLDLPRFSVIRLADLTFRVGERSFQVSPLQLRLAQQTGRLARGGSGGSAPTGRRLPNGAGEIGEDAGSLAGLVAERFGQILAVEGLAELGPTLESYLGPAYLADHTVFTLADLCSHLGIDCFTDGRVTWENFRLAPLFRPAGNGDVALVHTVFQEYLAARFLRTAAGREAAAGLDEPILTEQVRAFLTHLGTEPPPVPEYQSPGQRAAVPLMSDSSASADPLVADDPPTPGRPMPAGPVEPVLPAGAYLLGPSHRLLLRRIESPVRFDEFPVTVRRYRAFLTAVAERGSGRWDHPDTPPGHSHEPWQERLRNPAYLTDPQYADHPVVCVSWWSAYAFARFEGKRLPTSIEWEAAARGTDGRLFPWGDELDLAAVNCADAWSGHPLVTYEVWKQEIDSGRLRDCAPTSVTDHPANVSPFGVRGMAGNVWEWTSSVFDQLGSAVICGGSYDNPYRAVQVSSKALYVRRGSSNAVGFRCVREMP